MLNYTGIVFGQGDTPVKLCSILFVVSGFLTAYNFYNKNIEYTLLNSFSYYFRKYRQIFPIHILTAIIGIFLYKTYSFIAILLNILLLQSWSIDPSIFFACNGLSWFLSSLLFCYFMAPIYMSFLKSVKISMIALLATLLLRIAIEILPTIYPNQLWVVNCTLNPFVKSLEFLSGMLFVPLYFSLNKNIKTLTSKNFWSFAEILIFISTAYCFVKIPNVFMIPLFCILIFTLSFEKGVLSKILSFKFFIWFSGFQLAFYMFHHIIIYIFNTYYHQTIYGFYTVRTIIFITAVIISLCYTKYLDKRIKRYL